MKTLVASVRCTASSLLRKNVKSINRFVWLHLFDALKKRCYISPHNLHNHLLGCICPMHFSFVATAFFISHSPLNICCICTMHFSFVATHLHSFLNYAAKVASARCTLALLRQRCLALLLVVLYRCICPMHFSFVATRITLRIAR